MLSRRCSSFTLHTLFALTAALSKWLGMRKQTITSIGFPIISIGYFRFYLSHSLEMNSRSRWETRLKMILVTARTGTFRAGWRGNWGW